MSFLENMEELISQDSEERSDFYGEKFVVAFERDTYDPFNSKGPILFEVNFGRMTLNDAFEIITRFNGKYGKARIYKLAEVSPVEIADRLNVEGDKQCERKKHFNYLRVLHNGGDVNMRAVAAAQLAEEFALGIKEANKLVEDFCEEVGSESWRLSHE